ncbi:hypothetical protein M0802_013930 [Mischocyttarus mexicanus]|nr:hypothetical protein M0802_013930 [Mischocyttarus mexicanus]
MWSLGCILGEMLLGKPLFPGSSTINQVERIMATLPAPTEEDLISVSAGYGTNLLDKSPVGPKRSLKDLLPETSKEALDLIYNLIMFNPTHRLTAVEALEHPYVASFHRKGNEPSRTTSVVPLLRDDIQLSVEEYRNKLYAMMDEKHRKHKNMRVPYFHLNLYLISSKARVRRLSEHIRKETYNNNSTNNGNFVVGQGDATTGKNLRSSCGDLRNNKNNLLQATQQTNGKNATSQYGYNLSNGDLRNLPTGTTKSCLCLSQQNQHLSKSQRSIQSDQMTAYDANIRSNQLEGVSRTKLRRGNCDRQIRSTQHQRPPIVNNNIDRSNGSVFNETNNSKLGLLRYTKNLTTMLNNNNNTNNRITKHFVTTSPSNQNILNGISNSSNSGGSASSSELHAPRRSTSQYQIVKNYLNQSLPLHASSAQHQHRQQKEQQYYYQQLKQPQIESQGSEKVRSKLEKLNLIDKYRIKSSTLKKPELSKIHTRHSFGGFSVMNDRKNSIEISTQTIDSTNQSHGIITASVYKDLRNGIIRW